MQGLYDMTASFMKGVVVGSDSEEVPVSSTAADGPSRMVLQSVSFTESHVFTTLPPIASISVIPVGQEYFKKLKHVAGEPIVDKDKDDVDDVDLDTDGAIIIPPNITPENLEQFTFYEILGLSSFGDSADRFIIRKAYRQAVLLYHPDKMHSKGHTEEECRAIFLRVQEAAETLTDVAKRRAYDSLLDFDESIPTEAEAKEACQGGIDQFLQLFEPVFQRNARFALTKPVPSMGSANTPLRHVNSFYSYWVKFDSWRDFTNVEREHDPEQAQCREHKRWMAKENEKNAKKLKKKEMARILEFVTRALAHDPRVLAEKERVKNEKAAQKEEYQRKKDQDQKEKQEKAKRLEDEKDQSAKEEKLKHERTRKQASKARNTFRKLLRVVAGVGTEEGAEGGEFGIMTAADCDLICQSTDTAKLLELNEGMGGEAAIRDSSALVTTATAAVLAHLSSLKQSSEQKKLEELKQTEIRKKEHDKSALASSLKKKGVSREWTGHEFSVLSKGIKKFPAGSRQRWVTICNFMNDLIKPEEPYTKEECLQASQNAMKIMTASTLKASSTDAPATSATATPLPPPALTPTPTATAPATASSISTSLPSTSKQKVVSKVKPTPKAAAVVTSADKEGIKQTTPSGEGEKASLVWSQDQQKQLESGLKKYPASMDKNERWVAIAGDIPGKTKKDCILRFKKLREELQQQAAAAKMKK